MPLWDRAGRLKQNSCFPEAHPVFHPSQSSTYTEVGNHFSIQYGTGSLTGIIGADQVSVSTIPTSCPRTRHGDSKMRFRGLRGTTSALSCGKVDKATSRAREQREMAQWSSL